VATTERDELIRNHPVIGEVEFGIGEGKVPQTAHVAYFWETEKEFADGVRFLEAGLRGLDHCVILGHEEANQAVCNILQNHGFDVKDLLAQLRITILGGNPSGEKILETIGGAFQQALARGAPLIRLLGNIGWGKSGWPGDYDLLAFEAKVTAAAKEFPCVVICMYDVAALPGLVIRRGAYGTHPLIEREGSLQENPDYIPGDFFLKHLELIADALSERRQAQAESRWANESLHRSETYLAEAQRLSHTGSWAFNVTTREIVHWSQEHFRIFGFDPEDGMPSFETLMQRIHPDDRASAAEVIERGVRKKTDYEQDFRIVLPDGTMRYMHTTGHPVFNSSGDPVEFVGTVMDVTERKRTEEALRKTQADLAHVTRVATLGAMSTSIAHEINQPLAAVVTSASACLRWLDAQKLEEARRSASRVIAEGHRASEIIGRIRSLTKKAPPQMDWLDVNETIHEVIALARSEMQRNNIALETQLSEHVPVISADRIQLQQVILNLVMNGIEAMNTVTDRPREMVIRSSAQESGKVLVAVQDSGTGIDSQNLDKIFDTFYTTKPQGMGMGLAISRSIVENHGGSLWATANPDKGARFQFTLPTGGGNRHD
jgi:PAS domain S-box-containing protein